MPFVVNNTWGALGFTNNVNGWTVLEFRLLNASSHISLAAGGWCAQYQSVLCVVAGLCFADWAAVLTPHLQP